MINLVEVNKQLSEENFRAMGLDRVISILLPVIRELVISRAEQMDDLQKKLDIELVKNEELHKVIANITKNMPLFVPLTDEVMK